MGDGQPSTTEDAFGQWLRQFILESKTPEAAAATTPQPLTGFPGLLEQDVGISGSAKPTAPQGVIGKYSRISKRYVYVIPYDVKKSKFGKEIRLGMYSKLSGDDRKYVDQMRKK